MFMLPHVQLILEQAVIDETDPDVIDQLFEVLVTDFSVHAPKLHCKTTHQPSIGMLLRIAEKLVSMLAATLSRSSCCNCASPDSANGAHGDLRGYGGPLGQSVIEAVDDGRGALGDHRAVVAVLLRHASDHSGPLPAGNGPVVVRLQRRPATRCARYVAAV